MTVQNAAYPRQPAGWTITNGIDGFACLCCEQPHIDLLSDFASCMSVEAGAARGCYDELLAATLRRRPFRPARRIVREVS